jgi:tellurite resistance protein TerC
LPEVLWWHWLSFGLLVVFLLVLDLGVFHRRDHAPSLRESALFTAFWVAVGLTFNGLVWWWGVAAGHGWEMGVTFLSGYLIEESLSMDNIFVFVVIFRFFQIPFMYQYRVLFWGILGAIVTRLTFVLLGVGLIQLFEPVTLLFGVFLVYVAYKLARHGAADVHPEKNIVLSGARRLFPVSRGDHRQHGHSFFVREGGALCITPMFLVLLVIESTDVLFAVDSVPAVIGIIPKRFPPSLTTFIAFTSNVFAVLGLRALYFLLAGVVDLFRYLHYGLAAVLAFVGLKMIAEYVFKEFGPSLIAGLAGYLSIPVTERLRYLVDRAEGGHLIPTWGSLVVIVGILGISIVASLAARHRQGPPKGKASVESEQ